VGEPGRRVTPAVGSTAGVAPGGPAVGAGPAVGVGAVGGRRVRRRLREVERRGHRLTPRFSDGELEAISVAAALGGLTPTGYAAKAAVDVALARTVPVPVRTADALRELLEARAQVRRFGVLVNQAVAKLNASGELSGELGAALAACTRAVVRLEEAAVAVRGGGVAGLARVGLGGGRRPGR